MLALLLAFGSYGDVLPMIAIGAELRRRGHEVALASAEPFSGMAERAGLEFESLASADQFAETTSSPELWRPVAGVRKLFATAGMGVRPSLDFIRSRRRRRKTIVVGNSLALGARMAHDALGAPVVTVHMTAALMQSRRDPPRLPGLPRLDWLPEGLGWRVQMGVDERVIDPAVVPALNAYRAEVGLPPIRRLRHWWNAPHRSLLMCPPWYAAPQPEWPAQLRQCEFPDAAAYGGNGEGLDAETAAFLGREGPVAAVTFGSVMPGEAALYRTAVAACARAGLRTLVMTSTRIDLPPDLALGSHVTPYAPLDEVALRCAVALHHGGVGTASRFFAAGTPQLIVPLAFDQFDNAERARRLGCVAVMSRRWFNVRSAAARVAALRTSPAVAEAGRRVAALARADGAVEAAGLVEAEYERARAARAARRLASV